MKQLQHVTTFSLIIALTGLSPVVAADAGTTSDDERIQPDQRPVDSSLSYHLSLEQMDGINAGGRSGQPSRVNSNGRSGQPAAVNTSGRSGKPELSTPMVDPVDRTLVNTIQQIRSISICQHLSRSGQYGSVNTSGRR